MMKRSLGIRERKSDNDITKKGGYGTHVHEFARLPFLVMTEVAAGCYFIFMTTQNSTFRAVFPP